MNHISHAQARLWLSARLDGRDLPETQWTALQAHLESCADCRMFAAELAEEERCLHHAFHLRFWMRYSPGAWIAREVMAKRKARKLWVKWERRLGLYGLGALLLVLLFLWARPKVLAPAPQIKPFPTATATPSTPPRTFRGVLAYSAPDSDSAAGNNNDIFLLNFGPTGEPERSNLTNNPADDISPAWSWDGEWLAFLSNRAPGIPTPGPQTMGAKYEVYAIHVSGSRLTRLTDRPDIEWQGPISWAANGQMLALRGTQRGELDPRVFLIPLDGSGARSLAFTRGVTGPPRFSPKDMQVAYSLGDQGLMVFDLPDNELIPVALEAYDRPFYTGGPVFAWSTFNEGLAYLVEGSYTPNGEKDTVTMVQGAYISRVAGPIQMRQTTNPIATLPGANAVRGLAWSPAPGSANILAGLSDRQKTGCWYVALYQTSTAGNPLHEYPELCVDGHLDTSNWSMDGKWLVLLAHPADQSAPEGIYALRVDTARAEATRFERLADPPERSISESHETGETIPVSPQVRPASPPKTESFPSVPSHPHPAVPAEPMLPPSVPPAGTPGEILFNAQVNGLPQSVSGFGMTGSGLAQVRPDGGARNIVTHGEYNDTCPTWSPDRQHIAFLSNRSGEPEDRGRDVFVMATDGQYITRLTRDVFPQAGFSGWVPYYNCPVWSPDGSQLASVENAQGQYYLAILSADGRRAGYIPVDPVSYATGPVWSPDSRRVLLAHYATRSENSDHGMAYIEAIDLIEPAGLPSPAPTESYRLPTPSSAAPTAAPPGPPPLPYHSTRIIESDGWEDIFGMGFTPDGQIAFIALEYMGQTAQPYHYTLRLAGWSGQDIHRVALITSEDLAFYAESNPLLLLPNGEVGFLIRHSLWAAYKTDIYRFHRYAEDQPKPVARLDDLAYAAAWSPDGRWLAYSSDAGLSVLDLGGQAAPALLEQQRVYWVDWK